MNNLEKLNKILLSNSVVEKFKVEITNSKFVDWLTSIIPEVSACAVQKQDNPWHIYDCLDHILHSVEEMNKQTQDLSEEDRRLLAYVMFFHDMGKPETYIRRFGKAYGREIDSFFNHNKKSAEIANRTAKKFGFSEEESKIIEKLVFDHDMFMFITEESDGNPYHKPLTKKLIDEKVAELSEYGDGQKLMQYLIFIGRADNKSQNPEMTKNALKLLDKMEKMTKTLSSGDFGSQMH